MVPNTRDSALSQGQPPSPTSSSRPAHVPRRLGISWSPPCCAEASGPQNIRRAAPEELNYSRQGRCEQNTADIRFPPFVSLRLPSPASSAAHKHVRISCSGVSRRDGVLRSSTLTPCPAQARAKSSGNARCNYKWSTQTQCLFACAKALNCLTLFVVRHWALEWREDIGIRLKARLSNRPETREPYVDAGRRR